MRLEQQQDTKFTSSSSSRSTGYLNSSRRSSNNNSNRAIVAPISCHDGKIDFTTTLNDDINSSGNGNARWTQTTAPTTSSSSYNKNAFINNNSSSSNNKVIMSSPMPSALRDNLIRIHGMSFASSNNTPTMPTVVVTSPVTNERMKLVCNNNSSESTTTMAFDKWDCQGSSTVDNNNNNKTLNRKSSSCDQLLKLPLSSSSRQRRQYRGDEYYQNQLNNMKSRSLSPASMKTTTTNIRPPIRCSRKANLSPPNHKFKSLRAALGPMSPGMIPSAPKWNNNTVVELADDDKDPVPSTWSEL